MPLADEGGNRPQPVSYATAGSSRSPARFKVIGVASLVVSAVSLAITGPLCVATWRDVSAAAKDMAARRPGAYQPEIQDRLTGGWQVGLTSAALFAIALLLAGAAIRLLRSRPGGLLLHRAYAVLQIVASIAFGLAVMSAIYHSPVGMGWPLGAVPGVVGCLYPVVVLLASAGAGRR